MAGQELIYVDLENRSLSPFQSKTWDSVAATSVPKQEESWLSLKSPLPDVVSSLDGVGRPSPLLPKENYVMIKRLVSPEVSNREYKRSQIEGSDDITSEISRPADSLHPKTKPVINLKSSKRNSLVDTESIPPLKTIQDPIRPTCTFLQEDRLRNEKVLLKQSQWDKKRESSKHWRARLPPCFHSLPITAVRVRWPLGLRDWTYTLEMVHAVLSRFGHIESFGQLSPNSAVVVFRDVKVSATVVACSQRTTLSRLHCCWWFQQMWSYDTMMKERKSREKSKPFEVYDDLTLFKMRFKLVQEKVAELLQNGQNHMTYDMAKFVP